MANKVYELKDNFEMKYVILPEEVFEETYLCETFDDYGQKIDCCEVGCYCLANLESDFHLYMAEHFNWDLELMSKITDLDELEEIFMLNEIEYNIDEIKKYIDEHEEHIPCKAYNYWNGSNHRTYILESDLGVTGLSEVEPALEKRILAAFEKFDTYVYKGSEKKEEIDGFTFFYSLMSSFVFEAAIID
jgi:hypothetical protein